jgi:hypothetical protein
MVAHAAIFYTVYIIFRAPTSYPEKIGAYHRDRTGVGVTLTDLEPPGPYPEVIKMILAG